MSSRCGTGVALHETYGFVGSERQLLEAGLISSGTLDGLRARVLLTLLLAGGASHTEIVAVMSDRGSD